MAPEMSLRNCSLSCGEDSASADRRGLLADLSQHAGPLGQEFHADGNGSKIANSRSPWQESLRAALGL